MPTELNAIKDLEPVQHFVKVAEKFCALIENYETLTPYELARHAAELLPALYAVGLALPDVALPEARSEKPDAFYDSVPIKHTAALSRAIGEKIGGYNTYWQVLDPFEEERPVASMLGEDLADMYGDLKRGLIALDKGTDHEATEAIWHWRFSFGNHWGRHLVGALRALHYMLYDYLIIE
jgi:Domain of unknown function (DUF5063)